MRNENRTPKAPPAAPHGKTPAFKTKAERLDVQRVNRGTAPRRDPGTARRAAGRTNAPKGGRK